MADFGWAFVKGNLATGSAPPSGAVQYNDGNDKFAASGDFTFVSGTTSQLYLSGNLNVSGAINANEYNVNVTNQNVINLSATGSTKFGDSIDDTHVFTGSLNISAASNPIELHGLQSGTGIDQSSYLALNSNYQLVLTSAAGAGSEGGTIGEAEDGTYTDGLFSDFISSTPIGTAIDRFNEILKIIVPGPAPAVDRVNYTNTSGISLKIGEATSSYTSVNNLGDFQDNIGVSSLYSATTSGEDFRLGTYDGTQQITGTINFNVLEQLKSTEVNYSNNAFGNAESGSLKLYVNGTLTHTLNLDGFVGSGSPNTGSASDFAASTNTGFFDISEAAAARDQNGSEYDIFQHRTAKFIVDTPEQRDGWNYAQVQHEYGTTTYTTNFVQWFNDTQASSQSMVAQNELVTFTGHGPAKYLSGVEYFRSASLEYTAEATNFYKYTYPAGAVLSFNRSTNLDPIPSQTPPDITALDIDKVLQITASTETNDDTMLNDSATLQFNLTHPFKSNLSSAGSVNVNGILIYNVDNASTNTIEYFDDESYRLTSEPFDNQSDVLAAKYLWDSQSHMVTTGPTGHTTGLMFYDSKLISPTKGANSGDFSSLANGPSGNPDYSTITGTRTFLRKLKNTETTAVYDLKITSTKNTRINSSALSTNNVKFFVKIPEQTGWLDISRAFTYGSVSDNDGALITGASDNQNTSTTSEANSVHCVTFGTASIAQNDHVVIKIEADASWEKYIDELQFQLIASDVSSAIQAPTLDDIDLDDNGVAANLSFGNDNTISGYTNNSGSSIGVTEYDVNDTYPDNNDTRRGLFGAFEVMGGTLNEDVVASGNNYSNDSFFNAYTGSLVLEINGSEESIIDLESSLNSLNNIASDTGFSLSAVSFSATSDNIPDYTKPYRTGTYSIGTSLQDKGWNYARIIHRVGGVDTTTNYVDWIVDPSGSTVPMTFSSVSLSNFDHTDIYYQSGIGYFASRPTASYSYVLSEAYSNVYHNISNAISFPSPPRSNCSVTNIAINGDGVINKSVAAAGTSYPQLDVTVPGCEGMDIEITGTLLFDSLTSIKGDPNLFTAYDATVNSTALHPLKSSVTVVSQTKEDFMVFSGSLGSTNLNTQEYFGLETYRIVSGNYANQASVTDTSNAWDSTESVNLSLPSDVDQADGMVTINGYAISPLKIGDNGDTRNVAEGGVLQAPSGNPDYSTLNENIRTYYRYFRNETGLAKPTFTVTLYGDANLISKSGAFYTGTLGANKNIQVELKVPFDPNFTGPDDTSTAWGDCIKPYELGTQPNTDGVGIYNGGGSDLNQTVGSTGRDIAIQLQGSQVRDDQYFVLKISAHKDWTGYLSRIAITY